MRTISGQTLAVGCGGIAESIHQLKARVEGRTGIPAVEQVRHVCPLNHNPR